MNIVLALKNRLKKQNKGLVMVEMVILVPLFILIMTFMIKVLGFIIVIQKMEIASYYAARRWQLESHLNRNFTASEDNGGLSKSIRDKVTEYMKAGTDQNLFSLGSNINLTFTRTELWNIVQLDVPVTPVSNPALKKFMCTNKDVNTICSGYGKDCTNGYNAICGGKGVNFVVIKYVPNRDRPIKYSLPGLAN